MKKNKDIGYEETEKTGLKRYVKIVDSIAMFDNFVSPELCKKLINIFEKEKDSKAYDRYNSEKMAKGIKDDLAISFSKSNNWPDEIEEVCKILRDALSIYDQKTGYANFCGIIDLHFTTIKIQKTIPGGGYHVWHTERSHRDLSCKRALVWTMYLNDIKEGGETEFLMQKQRIKAKTGRVCIFPADYPYVHRGNPPLQKDKYILTSWFLST
tara:strand:- start:165 stop:797 length:633 start_codon:yes stop_codon:yes gene_type:complete